MTAPSFNLFESIATECRIADRVVHETLGGLRRTGWMNVVIAVTMASILSIFGTMLAFVLETQLFVNNIGAGLKISVYVQPQSDLSGLVRTIQQIPGVKKIDLVTKEDAWKDMQDTYQVPDIPNPLPDTLHVQMGNQSQIEPTAAKLKTLPGVEKVNYAQTILQKIEQIARIASLVGMVISVFLGTLTVFIISNTIHLLIEARGREIEIMRMMGVGNWYIRLPFLLQGAFYGLLGAVIACIPLFTAEYYINALFQYFQFKTSGYSQNLVLWLMLVMGILVGSVGAGVATRKYLKI